MLSRFINQIISSLRFTNPIHSSQIDSITDKKKLFPVIADTFEELTRPEKIFVDKSLLVKALLDSQSKYYLITRPRRWGKSLNLNMLETFFQADVNEKTGMPDFKKQSKKYLFEKLKIANASTLRCPINDQIANKNLIEYQGNFPVIKLTFTYPKITSKATLYEDFAEMLKISFKKHKYLLKSNKISSQSKEFKCIDAYINNKEITEVDIMKSLKYLIDALHEHYSRRVVLLIDEYDRTLTSLYSRNSEHYSDAIELLRCLFDPIKNNEKLLFTVFAGVTRLGKTGIFSGLNHLYHDSVVNSKFSEYFGFTETEVDFLLGEVIKIKPELSPKEVKDSITMWYNGYQIGNQTIYNPWSIMHCFDSLSTGESEPYRQYWIETGSTELIEKAITINPNTDKIEELIKYGETQIDLGASFEFEDIESNESSFLLFLLHSGYITRFKVGIGKIPNYEVQSYFFKNLIPAWLKKRIPGYSINFNLASFEDVQKYGAEFEDKFLENLIFKKYSELFFQCLVVIPFSFEFGKQPKYLFYSEKQTETNSKIDILFTPIKNNSKSVFLLELKKVETHRSINTGMKEALFQIFDKKYAKHALENAELPENNHWESFHVRTIVFSPNNLKTKWTISIKELTFSKEKFKTTYKNFEEKKERKEANEAIIEFLLSEPNSISEYPVKLSN